MIDIEERLAHVLHDRAAGDVDAAALAAVATARGRRRLIRRRIGLAGAAALTVLAVAAAVPSLVPGVGQGRGEYVAQIASAPEAPGAAARPDLVGTDPNVLHFAVDPEVGTPVLWASLAGRETIQLMRDGRLVTVDMARDVVAFDKVLYDGVMAERPETWTDTTVDGRPAKVGTAANGRVVRWSPANGVWIDVSGYDETTDDLRAVAEGLWLDEALRCSVPFQLTTLPTGARVSGCEVNARGYPQSFSGSVLVSSSGGTMRIHAEYPPGLAGGKAANYQVAGRDAFLYPEHDELELLDEQAMYLTARAGDKLAGLDVDDATLVLAGVRLADPEDLASWPSPLVSPTP
ncbi:MAG TPA: hypothetical protein VFY84_13155 [Jiangellales bacterium]|nr:hypothetical protein [Jiangellales bacterium]